MRIAALRSDVVLPADLDALAFEQDTELILRVDGDAGYPREGAQELLDAALEARGHEPGSVISLHGRPLLLLAIVHDLARDPSWREEWIAQAYGGVCGAALAHGARSLALPLLGTVHGRMDAARSRALLDAALARCGARFHTVWLRG